MEFTVSFTDNYLHQENKLPIPHLSFIIQLLLSKHCLADHTYIRKQQEELLVSKANNDVYFVPVGSFAEGYNIPDVLVKVNSVPIYQERLSDQDILIIHYGIEVVTTNDLISQMSQDHEGKKVLLLLNTRETHCGYARLEMCFGQHLELPELFVYDEETKIVYLSPDKVKHCGFSIKDKQGVIHGPAFTEEEPEPFTKKIRQNRYKPTKVISDKVIAYMCKQWPSIARPWIERQINAKWLHKATVDKIVDMGVHLVPTSHRHSLHPELEWRISFATAETVLAKEVITDYQRRCFIFLKIIYYIKLKPLDILTSYHLKTVFLYTCENLPVNMWKQNMGLCLLSMINCLMECVRRKYIPSFFIPENNLIDYISNDEASQVVRILIEIRKDPIAPVLEFSDTRVMYWQSLVKPFRKIIKPVLEDSVYYHDHRDIQKSVVTRFIPALFDLVHMKLIDNMPGHASECFISMLLSNISCRDLQVLDILNSSAKKCFSVIQWVIHFIDGLFAAYQYSIPCLLRGNIARMFQFLAYMHPMNSKERRLAFEEAEHYFNTVQNVMDGQNDYSRIVVDFYCFLVKQKRFNEAAEKLNRFINVELGRTRRSFHYLLSDSSIFDDALQMEILEDAPTRLSSLSLAYYLLFRCVVKDELGCADPVVYCNILQDFNKHCQKIDESISYSLLGYCYSFAQNWKSGYHAFCKAREVCEGRDRLIKENIYRCAKYFIEDNHKTG